MQCGVGREFESKRVRMTKFVAIDGEADNKGNYIIMCDSEGRVLHNPAGITTTEALHFILALPKRTELVCYGLNYDVNQWIKDLPRSNLERLAMENRSTWQGDYKLEWIPSKMFTVSVRGASRTVCEVFGFFQTSFVKALSQWGFDPPAEIEQMKQKRGTFTRNDLQAVVHYCQHECRLLVQMMERLQEACQEADCVPRRRWIGAGSIASSLLTSHGAKHHHAYDADLFGREVTDDYVLRAYFGGRVELYQQGWQSRAVAHDIRSAYPYAAMNLPDLSEATFLRTKLFTPGNYGLWRVSWDEPEGRQVMPFPVRLPKGDICYPRSGEGVYHTAEVSAALDCGYSVRVHDGVLLTPRVGLPFTWINDVYEHRARFKREGNYAEKALKLGLNSVYGKTAQGYGFGRKPPFQSYFWAGYITSYTRASALRMLQNMDVPVMTATDGIVGIDGIPRLYNDNIGAWEHSAYDRIATVQPGVYVAEENGERMVKSRGFFARDVDYDAMLQRFYDDPQSCYHFKSRRFIGLKVALHRKDFGVWRQWIDERRSIAFEIKNKIPRVHEGNVYLYPIKGPFESLPYVPKQSLYDDPSEDMVENMVRDDQPHREVD